MKKKSNKRKKYTVGGKVNSYIETPSDMLAENQIMMAQAELEAATNPFLQGMQSLSALMGVAGNTMMSMGGGDKAKPTEAVIAKYGANIEAEGGEVLELPGGNLLDLLGPSHEQGGMKLDNVPSGSTIFSDEIKIGGKSLADIKKKKSKDVDKYSKDSDGIAKNSKERAVKAEAVFDAMSNTLSNIFNVLDKQDKLNSTREKFKLGGTTVASEKPLVIEEDLLSKELFPSLDLNNFFSDTLKPSVGHTPGAVNMKTSSAQQINFEQQMRNIQEQESDAVSNNTFGMNLTPGDLLGVAGNIYQGVAPYLNTLRSRASDSPNVNEFQNFGNDALSANQESQQYAQTNLDNYLQDIELSTMSAKASSRNSARGVNTMRALDIATENNKQKATRAAYNDNADRMMNILTQKSQLENTQDKIVMSGEGAKNLANIEDKDNFFSNIGEDKVSLGKTVSSLAKFLNQSKERDVMANLMNSMYEHTGMDFGTGQMTGKETEASMAAKNDIDKNKKINVIASKSWKTATDNPFSKDGKYKSLEEYKKIKGIV